MGAATVSPCRLNKAGPAPRKKARPPPGWEHRPAGKTARKKRAARSFGRPDSLSKKVTGRWPFFSYRGKECSVMVWGDKKAGKKRKNRGQLKICKFGRYGPAGALVAEDRHSDRFQKDIRICGGSVLRGQRSAKCRLGGAVQDRADPAYATSPCRFGLGYLPRLTHPYFFEIA